MKSDCVFCKIASGDIKADIVDQDQNTVTFLDAGPVFPGHLLIVPRRHFETLADLPDDLLAPVFRQARRATQAVVAGLGADGSFMAVNNKISQSVPHLHVHVIPRRKGDGMKGFFWPRRNYKDDSHRSEVVNNLRQAFQALSRNGS
jgi:histidine triad (HIT) family protein